MPPEPRAPADPSPAPWSACPSTSTRSPRCATRAAASEPSVLEAVRRRASTPAPAASPCIRAPTSATSRPPTSATSRRSWRRGATAVEYNIEGDPRAELLALVHEVAAAPVHARARCRPGEVTSQAGWPPDTPRAALADVDCATCSAPASASACSSIPIRRGRPGRAISAPTAWSSTPSRSRAPCEHGPEAAAAGFARYADAARHAACASGSA